MFANTTCIAILISILSLGFSLYVYFAYQKKLNEQQEKINDLNLTRMEQEKDEQNKARLTVNNSGGYLYITNEGPATARNVRFECSETLEMRESYLLPCPELKPGAMLKIRYLKEFVNNPYQTVTLTWDDNWGKDNKEEYVVSLRH